MADLTPWPADVESLEIYSHVEHGAYLNGLVARRVGVSQLLLDAVKAGAAGYARYYAGLTTPDRLVFELHNVHLEYVQVDRFEVTDNPNVVAQVYYVFELAGYAWAKGAVSGERDGREYALICRCAMGAVLADLNDNPRCPIHGEDPRYAFSGKVVLHA
jgi:hypothetical protein